MAEIGHHTASCRCVQCCPHRNQNSPPHEHSLETNSSSPTPSVALASLETHLETLAISDTPIGDHMSSTHIPAQTRALPHIGGTHAETNSSLDPLALGQESNTSSSGGQAFEVPTLDLQAISEHNSGEQAENDSLAHANTENIDSQVQLCPLNDTDGCVGDCPYLHGPLCPFCHMSRLNPQKPDLHLVSLSSLSHTISSPPHEHSLETNSSNPAPSVALASLETQLETFAISDTPIGDHMSSTHIPAQTRALPHTNGTYAETNSSLDPSALGQESNTSTSGGQALEVPTLDLQAISEHNSGEQAENDSLAHANTENIDSEEQLCPLNDTYVCFGDCPYEHGPLCPFCHMYRINPDKPDLHVLSLSSLSHAIRLHTRFLLLDYM
nr:putative E3 ubiquitin-protein ligase makorin-1 [Biomphalaria glabrata]